MHQVIFIVVIALLVFGFLLDKFLDFLNLRTWEKTLPPDLKDFYSEETYLKARQYYYDKEKLSSLSDFIGFIVTLTFLLSGGFAWLNSMLEPVFSNPVFLGLVYFAILYFATDILSIPFSIYSTFVIEQKYGFNKTSPKTFITDKLKSYLLTILIGGIVGFIVLELILILKDQFWIAVFLVILGFTLFFNMFYTTLILPLFNKLKPMEEGELRNAIEAYAKSVNFPLQDVYIIDGSKRSSKANAYFTGLWKKKKVVLYDTLIEKHSTDELVAILAHEVGHFRKKHIIKNLILSSLQTFIMLFLMSRFIFEPALSQAFGIESGAFILHINLIAFAMLYEPVSLLLGLLGNFISRKHEYQADEFAVQTTRSSKLADALKNLSTTHLANLKPHPLYVFFYYSHPPTLQRLENIHKLCQKPL